MSDEEKIQSLVTELRFLEGRLNEVDSQRALLIRIFTEARAGLDALKGLNTSSPSEVLIPVGGGVFVKGNTPPPDKLLVGIGADVVVERSRDDALKYVEERLKEMENAVAGLEARRNDLTKKINAQRAAINSIVAKHQG